MHRFTVAALPLLATGLLAQGTPEVEPNDTAGSATTVAAGDQADGVIATAGDFDYYAITLGASSDLRVWINPGTGAVPLNDSDLTLFDVDGVTVLGFNDDVSGVTNWLSRLLAGNLPAGTYYAMVRSSQAFTPNGVGTYTLDVIAAAPGTYVSLGGSTVPTGPSTVVVNTGGCGPTLGTRLTTGGPAIATEVPVLGSAFYVDGGNMAAGSLLMRVIGLVPLAMPFDLGPLGASGCFIEVDPLDQAFAIANGSGIDHWLLSTPVDVAFVGLPIEQQIAVVDLPANALGITVSNTVSSVFGIEN